MHGWVPPPKIFCHVHVIMIVLLTGYDYDPELTQKKCVYLFLLLCCTSLATTITPPPACLSPYHHHTSTSSFIHDLSCCSRWCRKSLLKSHFFIIFTSPELPYCLLYIYMHVYCSLIHPVYLVNSVLPIFSYLSYFSALLMRWCHSGETITRQHITKPWPTTATATTANKKGFVFCTFLLPVRGKFTTTLQKTRLLLCWAEQNIEQLHQIIYYHPHIVKIRRKLYLKIQINAN